MPKLPTQPPKATDLHVPKAKEHLNRWLKLFGWSLVVLLVVSEEVNLLLPLLPINDILCKRIQNEAYKETGLLLSTKTISLQWHLWEGATVKLHDLDLLPHKTVVEQKTAINPLWSIRLKDLSLGVDIFSLVFNKGNGAIYQLAVENPTVTVKGKTGFSDLQATFKRIAEKPKPPNAPQWIEQLDFSLAHTTILLSPPVQEETLRLNLPTIKGQFNQRLAIDPFDITLTDVKALLVAEKIKTQKRLATISAKGDFSLPAANRNAKVLTQWETIWQVAEGIHKLAFTVESGDSNRLIQSLLQQGLLDENPLKKASLQPKKMKLQGQLEGVKPHQWEVMLSGFSTLDSISTHQQNNAKPTQADFNTTLHLTKQAEDKALLTLKAFRLNHAESKAVLEAKGTVTLTEKSLNSFEKLPFALDVSGNLPYISNLPNELKSLSLPATKETQALHLALLKGGVTLQHGTLTGTIKTPVIDQLKAQLNQVTLQATTQGRLSPIIQSSGTIDWLKSGSVKGAFTVVPHETLKTPPATITLNRTIEANPISVQVSVPALQGSVVSAWQPWAITYLSPSLKKAPAYQWQNLSWQGETTFKATATYQPTSQRFSVNSATGSLNQWHALLNLQPWMGANGNWQWQLTAGLSPKLQIALANQKTWLTVGGRWHTQQPNSAIKLTAHKATIPSLIERVLKPLNHYCLPPAQQLSETQLNQWLADPTLQPWLHSTASAQATLSPQRLTLQTLTLEGLAKTGKATLKAVIPWQALTNHSTLASASVAWQKIPIEPFPLAFKQALTQADLQLKKLTGDTNGTLTWAGAIPKSVVASDFSSPQRLGWLRPLTGTIDISAIEGQWEQHPTPFQISPLQLHLHQLALSHENPLKVTWGPASVLGNLGFHPTQNQHWQPMIDLDLAPIPLETFKTEHAFYAPILSHLKLEYPTFWRTAGTVAGDVHWNASGNAPMAQLHLANAGFYIPRTLAPLHGVTGTFQVDILKHALSLPEPLFVQLGNSTMLIPWLNLKNTGNQWHLNLQAQGRLHPRELNSLLGNNWYFQPTQYPWLADSWLGLKASWGGEVNHTQSNIEANLSSVLQAEGKIAAQTESPLAEETTAKALVMQETEAEKSSQPPAPPVKPTISVLSPSKLASISQKTKFNNISTGVPKLLTLVESASNSNQEVVWYQKQGSNQPLKELARYPLTMENQPLATMALQFKGKINQPRLELGELRLLGRSEPLRFQASLDAPTQPTHLWSNQGRIWTEESIELDALAQLTASPAFRFESGKVVADLHWQQADSNPMGQLQLQAVQSAGLGIDNLEVDAQFKAAKLDLTIPQFKAGGSDVGLAGNADLPQPLPVSFNELNIVGKTFYVEGFLGLLDKLTLAVITPYKQGLPPTVRWVPERTISLPLQVEGGTITLEEAIVNNILATNYSSKWKLFPNGYMALDDMDMAVAGGTVKGQFSMNPSQRNTLSMKIDADHVKANALARALLNAPNQVFGDLTGGIDFATYGYTPVALIQHANGKTHFVIAEGRVPALDKVERLLSTANVVRGGVLGFNFNNLAFALKGGLKSGAIRAISGDFQVVDGQLLTRNFLSDSTNLDLAMSGGVRLDNGLADLVIIGIMPQNVAGKGFLGKLGDFSLGKAFKYVPVLGYIPLKGGNNKGVFDYIPGLGYVPGLGGVPGKTNSFEALLKGPPDDPTSIKSIRWLRQGKAVEPSGVETVVK